MNPTQRQVSRPDAPVDPHEPVDIAVYRRAFTDHILADDPPPAARRWRLRRFDRGLKLAGEIEARIGPLAGRGILEIGTAHGGDLCALAAAGARCVGIDKYDHRYGELIARVPDRLRVVRTDCTADWPFADHSFDVVISFSVIELVGDLDRFFRELVRVLKPGGVALVDTGTALRMVRNDAIYHLPLVSLFPTPVRRFIAERIFGRRYHLPLADHTFYTAGTIKRFVARYGCTVIPSTYRCNRWIDRVSRWPASRIWRRIIRYLMFDFVLIVAGGDHPSGRRDLAAG